MESAQNAMFYRNVVCLISKGFSELKRLVTEILQNANLNTLRFRCNLTITHRDLLSLKQLTVLVLFPEINIKHCKITIENTKLVLASTRVNQFNCSVMKPNLHLLA